MNEKRWASYVLRRGDLSRSSGPLQPRGPARRESSEALSLFAGIGNEQIDQLLKEGRPYPLRAALSPYARRDTAG